jgi:hypothetical protein
MMDDMEQAMMDDLEADVTIRVLHPLQQSTVTTTALLLALALVPVVMMMALL